MIACHAVLHHGPGHQTRTACTKTGPHVVHECTYGSYQQVARWFASVASTSVFDDPPMFTDVLEADAAANIVPRSIVLFQDDIVPQRRRALVEVVFPHTNDGHLLYQLHLQDTGCHTNATVDELELVARPGEPVPVPKAEQERLRIVEITEQRKEFVTDVDGFVYWWPEGSKNGHLSAHHLRWLADELDRRNAAWNKTIADDFKKREAADNSPQP